MTKKNISGLQQKTDQLTKQKMNKELEQWVKESESEGKSVVQQSKTKSSKKTMKKPRGTCEVCGKEKARFVCAKCNRNVCSSCFFNLVGICKQCIPEELVDKWKNKLPDWEKILQVDWVE